jgi:hypothetical protein
MVSLIGCKGLGEAMQNLRLSPKRFVVPGGVCLHLHRLCFVRFCGCCCIRNGVIKGLLWLFKEDSYCICLLI